ncbi:MAG TPA: CDP-alcohol phosphatidyltransferase family protein [Polyangiales bacterium]|nr:CDP-alcohol phosphatidyltransferase family protein [Polyangiales bacterium]
MNDSTTNLTKQQNRQRFSMLRTFALADVLTLANGFCGAGSILALMQHIATGLTSWLWVAIVLLPIALFFDFADGRVARWRHRSSPLGADLDSLADVISFGMAPAALGFAAGLRSSLDVAVLLYFVACGISRLARFNVTAGSMSDESGKVSHFEGTPIPTSVLIVGLWGWLLAIDRIGPSMWLGWWDYGPVALHPLSLVYFLSGSAMISTFRIPKL